jgi:hypothetical protein
LMFDELLSGNVRLFIFISSIGKQYIPSTLIDWENAVIAFLKKYDRWNTVKHYL